MELAFDAAAGDYYRKANVVSVLQVDMTNYKAGAVTDNPIVFPETGDLLSGGNFHGEPIAIAIFAAGLRSTGTRQISPPYDTTTNRESGVKL